MKISKRLKQIASYVDDNSSVIDVGCDHALLSIYLVENKKNIKVTASDINEGPLQKAKENIKKFNMEDKIEVSLANGLEKLTKETDTVVIAGMGYLTIKNILENGNLDNIKTMILSVNDDFDLLKNFMRKIGFSITKEEIIEDHNKFYIIIKAVKGRKKYKNEKIMNEDYVKYLKYTLKKNEELLNKVPKNKTITRFKLRKEIKRINKELK